MKAIILGILLSASPLLAQLDMPFWILMEEPVATVEAVVDTIPDAFVFTDVTDATISTEYISNAVALENFDSAYAYAGGESFKIDYGGSWVTAYTKVYDGDSIYVKQTSSGSYETQTDVTLTAGGVNDTYSVTTEGAPANNDNLVFHINQDNTTIWSNDAYIGEWVDYVSGDSLKSPDTADKVDTASFNFYGGQWYEETMTIWDSDSMKNGHTIFIACTFDDNTGTIFSNYASASSANRVPAVLVASDNTVRYRVSGASTTNLQATASFSIANDYVIVCSYDATQDSMKIWLNGTLETTMYHNEAITTQTMNTVRIGNEPTDSYGYDGDLYEIRVYGRSYDDLGTTRIIEISDSLATTYSIYTP